MIEHLPTLGSIHPIDKKLSKYMCVCVCIKGYEMKLYYKIGYYFTISFLRLNVIINPGQLT